MYAIIETGGKQYKITKDSVLKVEKLNAEIGTDVVIDKIMVISDNERIIHGSPYIAGAKVVATVEGVGRYPKIIVHKQRPRKVYRKTNGHRQFYTSLKIKDIILEA